MRKLRVCMLSTNFSYIGNAAYYDLAKELASMGHEVDIVIPHKAGEKKLEKKDGLAIHRFQYMWPAEWQTLTYGSGMWENWRRSFMARLQAPFLMVSFLFAALGVGRKADIIHAHWVPSGFVSLFLKWIMGKPVVLTVHGNDIKKLPKWFTGFVVNNCDAVSSSHPDMLAAAMELAKDKTKVHDIKNAVNFGQFSGLDKKKVEKIRDEFGLKGKKVVTFIARFVDWKDPLTFVKAVPYVVKRHPEARFLAIGDGEMMPEVKKKAKELGIEKYVFLTGRRPEVNAFLSLSDVFTALSTLQNVFSVSIIEAMMMERACVLTRAGDTEKYFKDGKDCLLVPVADEKALGNAINSLLDRPALRGKIAKGGKGLIKELGFDKESVMGKNIALYEALVKG